MTTVAFHFNVADRLAYTCRLLRKAVAGGVEVVVIGSGDTLTQLDRELWTFSSTDFVTHYRQEVSESIAGQSSVVLAESIQGALQRDVLVNLGELVPDNFERFDRVIEVVSKETNEKIAARLRWKHYAHAGINLVQHDLDQKVDP